MYVTIYKDNSDLLSVGVLPYIYSRYSVISNACRGAKEVKPGQRPFGDFAVKNISSKVFKKKKVDRYFDTKDVPKGTEVYTVNTWKIRQAQEKRDWKKRNKEKKDGQKKETGNKERRVIYKKGKVFMKLKKKIIPNREGKAQQNEGINQDKERKNFIMEKPLHKHEVKKKQKDGLMKNERRVIYKKGKVFMKQKKSIIARQRKPQQKEGRKGHKERKNLKARKPMHKQRINQEMKVENKRDPFPGPKPIPEETIRKYERGEHIKNLQTRSELESKRLKSKEEKLQFVAKQAARTELIMQEESGFLEADENEDTGEITQHDIAEVVDITSAQKFFELKMNDFGPYKINYTRNGRFLLFGGAKGHVAAIDWMTKKLLCEINVMETLHDVRWLHQETMYAVAQKQWTYIYDNQGIELHCLKRLDRVLRMEFLPFHFLLATANVTGYLSYIDVSVGEKVAGYSTHMGRLDVMCQNPSNAVIHLGHSGGTVSLWCPKVNEPLVKMLCHGSGVRSIAIDKTGQYMATSGIDRTMKIWDLRTYKTLQSYKLGAGAGQLTFSQTGLLAAGVGNIVQVYQDCIRQTVTKPYMTHNLTSSVNSLQFCPYEDVLGVGHGNGFSSLIIPGAGEANFDALEANPYQTKKQRREAEVKMLLDKIPAEMIHIDSGIVGRLDQNSLTEKIEERNKKLLFKPQKKDFQPKYKMKGRSKTGKYEQRKKGVIHEHKRAQIKEKVKLKQKEEREKQQNVSRTLTPGNVLDRFKRKEL